MKSKKPKKDVKPKGKYYTEIKVKETPDQLLNTLLNTPVKPIAKGKK